MVGAYMQAIEAAGLMDSTYWVITADHGDMQVSRGKALGKVPAEMERWLTACLQMEHQQFYKMVPYDASASVGRSTTALGYLYAPCADCRCRW